MTTPVVSSTTMLSSAPSDESKAPATRAYRTKTPFAAVHFDQAAKGRIVFLPKGAILRIIGPSPFLGGGFEVTFKKRSYNIFEIDLITRSSLIVDPLRVTTRAVKTEDYPRLADVLAC